MTLSVVMVFLFALVNIKGKQIVYCCYRSLCNASIYALQKACINMIFFIGEMVSRTHDGICSGDLTI